MSAKVGAALALTLLAGATLVAEYAYAQAPNRPAGADRKEWLSDYELLKSRLERSYSPLAWAASPESGVNLPDLDDRTKHSLQGAQSVEDAKAAVLAFVAGFHDGHFAAAAFPVPRGDAIEPPAPAAMPDAATACAAYGYEARTSVSFSLPFESLQGFTLYSDGLAEAFRSGVIEADGVRMGIVRIPRFRATEYPALCRQLWASLKMKGEPIGPA